MAVWLKGPDRLCDIMMVLAPSRFTVATLLKFRVLFLLDWTRLVASLHASAIYNGLAAADSVYRHGCRWCGVRSG